MKRPDAADLTRYGVGSTLLHTVSKPHSIWVRHEDGWRNPVGSPSNVYDDKWADGCLPQYADLILRVDPEPAVELPTEPTLGWLDVTDTGVSILRVTPGRVLGMFKDRETVVDAGVLGSWSHDCITAFTPATAVPTEALDELREIDSRCEATYPDYAKAVTTFLRAVVEAQR